MSPQPLRALLVEDDPMDADLLLLALRDGGFQPTARIVDTEADFTAAVRGSPWDVVIADYNVPGFDAPASLAAARRHAPDVPFIVVSGVFGEQAAVTTMRDGAVDYLRKDHLERLAPALRREVQEAADRAARRVAERALIELEIGSKRKSAFLANLSHEMRTPLNAIIGFSQVLHEQMFGELNDRQTEYVQHVLTSGEHLLSLVNDILDLAKVEAGRTDLELSEFSLREVLDTGLTLIQERADSHHISLSQQVAPGLDTIEADKRKIKQVLLNVLSNAAKFTPDGGSINVSARLVGDLLEVAVTDTGIGIAPQDQARVFDEFEQVAASTNPNDKGSGLGLPLAKRLVELHGGRMWLDSASGQGSTFTFTLPRQARAQAQRDAPGSRAAGALAARILIVAEDPYARELLRLHVEHAGFRVDSVQSGEQGLQEARELRPAVIVVDGVLPHVDGLDFAAQVTADSILAGTLVIMVSVVDERGQGFASGPGDYLVSPDSRESLVEKLRRVLPAGGAVRVLAVDDPGATAGVGQAGPVTAAAGAGSRTAAATGPGPTLHAAGSSESAH